jgi:hypothetical protein
MKDCTNTGGKVAMVTRFSTAARNICGSSVTVLASSILRLILDFVHFWILSYRSGAKHFEVDTRFCTFVDPQLLFWRQAF